MDLLIVALGVLVALLGLISIVAMLVKLRRKARRDKFPPPAIGFILLSKAMYVPMGVGLALATRSDRVGIPLVMLSILVMQASLRKVRKLMVSSRT